MMEEKTGFSDLAQELRDMIWERAVRPEAPGVHFFTVHDARRDTLFVNSRWSVKTSTDSSHDRPQDFAIGFAAPRCGPHGNLSWTQGNISTYMEDSALWTTCRDSRRYMIQRFRPAETSRRIVREKPWVTHRQVTVDKAATVTAVLQGDSGERQYFTIQPMQDLIVIQTSPDSCMSWDQDIDGEMFPPIDYLWRNVSRKAPLAWSAPKWDVCAPRNIAIEFDSKWMEQPEKYIRPFEGLFLMKDVQVWFVDHKLQRDLRGVSDEIKKLLNAKRDVFHAQDRRFVEARQFDAGWCIHDEPHRDSIDSDVFKFVKRLEVSLWSSALDNPFDDVDRYFRLSDIPFKVLGCELL